MATLTRLMEVDVPPKADKEMVSSNVGRESFGRRLTFKWACELLIVLTNPCVVAGVLNLQSVIRELGLLRCFQGWVGCTGCAAFVDSVTIALCGSMMCCAGSIESEISRNVFARHTISAIVSLGFEDLLL